MPYALGYITAALWVAWFGYWIVSSGGVKPAARSASWQSRLAYSAPLWVAVVLLINRDLSGVLDQRFLPADLWIATVGVALTAAGHGFAICARRALGTNWSREVTVKLDHELVQSGPYAFVRHPIYTGLSLAFLGTAIAIGEWRGLLAMALAVGSFWYKLGIEERVMTETFGTEYANYRKRVKALIPFLL